MALQKQSIDLSFYQGLDLKDDPFRVPIGRFLTLVNSVFDSVGRLTKRNGFGTLPALPVNPSSSWEYLTTFSNNLTAIGTGILSYSTALSNWEATGVYTPLTLSTLSLVRNNANQINSDTAFSPNGLMCVAYTQTSDFATYFFYYSILDPVTGQTFSSQVSIPSASGNPRVFALGIYFVIVFPVSGSLKYIAINSTTLVAGSPTLISNSFFSGFDGAVNNTTLFLAWNGGSSSGIFMAELSSILILGSTTHVDATNPGDVLGVWIDTTQAFPEIWVGYWGQSSTNGFVLAVDNSLSIILAPTQIITAAASVSNITGYAQNQIATVLYEVPIDWNYDSTIQSSEIIVQPVTLGGSVGSPSTILDVGLASKGFIYNSQGYVTAVYGSKYQPSYFLLNIGNGGAYSVVTRYAYQNGGSFYVNHLPSVNVNGSTIQNAYLFKDLTESVNKSLTGSVGGIYSQTGINLATISFANASISSLEAGSNLNISGGFLWGFDGAMDTENNFFLWPELQLNGDGTYHGISFSNSTTFTGTGNTVLGSNLVTSFTTGGVVVPGMTVSGTGIAAGTTAVAVLIISGVTTLQISQPATGNHSSVTLTFAGAITSGASPATTYFYVFCCEYTDNQGNIFKSAPSIPVSITPTAGDTTVVITMKVPCLNFTYKITNPIKIVGYRASSLQGTFYQFTSILQPPLNNIAQQTITILDASSDATILGNNLLYTTGGVLENIAPPSSQIMTLFDDRVWLVDAEDQDLLWFSKQIIEATPVEMTDLQTFFVAPTLGGQGNTGHISALASMDDKLIIFKKNSAMYYVNGTGPDSTGSNSQYSQPVFITSPVSCDNQKSLTLIPSGLVFQSRTKGIWLLSRDLQVSYIGAAVEAYNQYQVTSATTIPGTNQVRFSLSNGTILMYDYFVNQWGTFSGISSVSSTIYNSLQTIINSSSVVSQETPGVYLDGATPTVMSFTTSWIAPTGIQGYQRAWWAFLLGQYESPHTLTVGFAYDYNATALQTIVIHPDVTKPLEDWQLNIQRQTCQSFQMSVQENYDSSIGPAAGAGLTLSGINLVVGLKKSYPRTLSVAQKTG